MKCYYSDERQPLFGDTVADYSDDDDDVVVVVVVVDVVVGDVVGVGVVGVGVVVDVDDAVVDDDGGIVGAVEVVGPGKQ